MSDSYSEQLVLALRLRDVPGQRIGQIVAEVESFTADSGQDPADAFGAVEAYSDDIAAQLRREPAARRLSRELFRACPPAVGSLVLVDGLVGAIDGGRAELTVGKAVFVTLLPLCVVMLFAALLRADRWTYVVAALIAVAGVAVMWTGDDLVLLRYPAWAGIVCGATALVGSLSLAFTTARDPVIDPRTSRDRYPMSLRFAVLAGGPMAIMLIVVMIVAVVTD